ncbi:SGNH/GDSL hydrolase family protein [Mycolicibacterium diernhoferi]|uniref:Hydrolase n=2 Tax=Mycolicibacterium diernhoferi TaxID=1801 RepID=A0A1Q4H490_9MYCO|nr:SGNH/GDSL hydrolase family protein [Mycolicibacterium diernhoferi]OJZ61612.1 hydrolase [Mycolicibacterium diernhoferi]OPE53879.1 hydrolase [Mycolicibacterium diernhoferi]QYL23456.1 SGNH/GDSL hydrolase family protein [Mycolicibacterium diernhoferi]
MTRYVALGSSMAAGPGISPKAPGSPLAAMRSARNYPHLVARDLGLDLVDVTYSGATTAHVLTDSQHGEPPQVEALDGSEALVTVTIGGNDVGYVPMLCAAALPAPLRWLPPLRGMRDPAARRRDLRAVAEKLVRVGSEIRRRAPRARVMFVDYLTLLPPHGTASPLSPRDVDLGREIAAELERLTAAAAGTTGCGVVRAAEASRAHHAWSARPWTTLPSRFPVPIPGHTAPLHPNADGMRAVADLMVSECGVAEFRA